jgi:peptidoglycan/LPS O-acetylase OafA/YrhL
MAARTMRHGRWLRDEIPFVLVVLLVVCAAGVLAVWPDRWRPAVTLIASAMFIAAGLRLVLPPHRVGALAVRKRWFDVLCYLAIGVVIVAVAIRLH